MFRKQACKGSERASIKAVAESRERSVKRNEDAPVCPRSHWSGQPRLLLNRFSLTRFARILWSDSFLSRLIRNLIGFPSFQTYGRKSDYQLPVTSNSWSADNLPRTSEKLCFDGPVNKASLVMRPQHKARL